MNLIGDLLKKTEKIDFLFPNSFDELINNKYYDYDKFEWFLYYVFKLDGNKVEKVGSKGRGDGGADLILSVPQKDGAMLRIGIQAKYWKNRVGTAPINQLASAKARHGLTHLWIITTSDLTSDAKEIAESLGIKILRAEDVEDFIKKIRTRFQEDIDTNGQSSIEFLQPSPKTNKLKEIKELKNNETSVIDDSKTLNELGTRLKSLRIELAKKTNSSLWAIYNNETINELIKNKPSTLEELLKIKGFGTKKVEAFGDEIIAVFKKKEPVYLEDAETRLYNILISERPKIASFNKLEQDQVYTDKVASYLAKMKPRTKEDLEKIFGFEKKNIEIFGDFLIKLINKNR